MNPCCNAALVLQNGKLIECNRDEGHTGAHMLLIKGEGAIVDGGLVKTVVLDDVVYAWPAAWGRVAGSAQRELAAV